MMRNVLRKWIARRGRGDRRIRIRIVELSCGHSIHQQLGTTPFAVQANCRHCEAILDEVRNAVRDALEELLATG